MENCTFCGIVSGKLPGKIVFKDERATAFHDIHPAGPTHILIVPNKHIISVNDLVPEDEALIGHLFTIARQLAESECVDKSGYRLIVNTGRDANQTIFHLHMHLIGGQPARYPMG